jgi:hypothetical protein
MCPKDKINVLRILGKYLFLMGRDGNVLIIDVILYYIIIIYEFCYISLINCITVIDI